MDQEKQLPQTGNRSLEMCCRTVTTESFIAEAKEIYGDRYDYSKVEYKNRDHKVTITCPIHGDFLIFAREHLDGKGCPKCEKGEKFLVKLREKFGDKFGLEHFVYDSSTLPVTLVCPKHGAFSRLPNQILNSSFGCPECGKEPAQQAHVAAETKKEEQKRLKQEAADQAKAKLFTELDERIDRIKQEMQRWLNTPTSAMANKLGVGAAWILYQRLVDARIDDVRYNSNPREEYRKKYLVEQKTAELFSNYEEGDLLYRFPGEAAHQLFIKSHENCAFSAFPTLEQALSHRNCFISFKDGDLYVLEKSYQRQAIPQPKKQDVATLPTSYVSIDFETLYSQPVSACSVGLVKYENGKPVAHYYSLIRPPFDYEGKKGFALTNIHGIRKEDLESERTMESILPEIEKFVGKLPLVAHNAAMEKSCLRDTIEYYNLSTSLEYGQMFDTLYLSREIEKQLNIFETGEGTHTLDAVCRRFGLKEGKHHNALDDAEMCGNLILAFQAALNNGKVVPLDIEPLSKTHSEEGTGLFSFFKKIGNFKKDK